MNPLPTDGRTPLESLSGVLARAGLLRLSGGPITVLATTAALPALVRAEDR
jgi:hypothetical protein